MEDTSSTRRSSRVDDYDVHSPCNFLRKAVNAMLKCLGFDESKPCVDDDVNKSSSCSKEKDEKNFNNEQKFCGQGGQSSYSPLDPPSSMDPADDPPMETLAGRGRTPPRPGIGTRNPQTNSSSS